MDKSTITAYGWIIIVSMIMAVMLALSTPFGTYVGDGLVSIANGMVQSANNAMDEDNIDQMKSEWVNELDYSIFDETTNSNSLSHSGKIPEGAVLYNKTQCENCYYSYGIEGEFCYSCDREFTGKVYNAGEDFPTINQGAIYVYGDYKYCFGYGWCGECGCWANECGCIHGNEGFEHWGVKVLDTSKEQYQPILESINDAPIAMLDATFFQCNNMIVSPEIPETVVTMRNAYSDCYFLSEAPKIPDGVTDLYFAFAYCNYLTVAPEMPKSAYRLWGTFYECLSLVTPPPVIYEDVYDMDDMFNSCYCLTGTIEILGEPNYTSNTFYGTSYDITLTGPSSKLYDLAMTSDNNNIYIG